MVVSTTRDVSRVLADTTKDVSSKAIEMGKDVAQRYQAQQANRLPAGTAEPEVPLSTNETRPG